MDSAKDPAFKLFGRKIQVTDVQIQAKPQPKNGETDVCKEDNSELSAEEGREAKQECQMPMPMNQEAQGTSGSKEERAETDGADREKVPKKPDKILPCPRCNSLETKFCYFNNYNVNQPRHFCKNCQRYWTAGGTMRNVPIGAGRRKNKHLASQYRQILVSSDGVPITAIESSESSSHQFLSSVESANNLRPSTTGKGVVLKFGPEAPLCESMETVLNLGEQKRNAEMSSANCQDNGEEPSSCGSSMTSSSCQENGLPETVSPKEQGGMSGSTVELNASHPLHCYPVPPWVVPWNPNWRNAPSVITSQQPSGPACSANSNNANQVQWYPTPILAVPSFCPPSIPLQLVPASYLGCMPVWPAPGAGNISANGSNGCSSPSSPASTSCCSGNGSPKLGKHSRDASYTGEEQPESCVLVPKTLRIDDPSEASRSPLWSTLGLKLDQKIPVSSRGTVIKTLETSKAEGIGHVPESTHILEANPAALSRSTTFLESS